MKHYWKGLRQRSQSNENAEAMEQLTNLKKLKADGDYYRIRIGDYRIGIVLDGDAVIFVRVLHRKDIYRHFP